MTDSIELAWEHYRYEKNKKPTVRNSHSVAADTKNHHIFVFGGRSKGGSNNHLYLLHRDEGWERLDVGDYAPSNRKSAGLAFVNNHLYLFGGNTKDNLLNDMFKFSLESRKWTQIKFNSTKIPVPRDRCTFTVVNGSIYLFGGHSDDAEFLNDLWIFDPEKEEWTELSPKGNRPCPRYEHAAVSIYNNKLVIIGGKCNDGGLSDIQIYDTSYNKFEDVKLSLSSFENRWGHSAIEFSNNVITFGGWNGKNCFNDIHVLKCDNNSNKYEWIQFQLSGNRPSIRTFHAAGVYKNYMVIVGGRNMKQRLNDTYFLDLGDLSPHQQLNNEKLRKTQDNLPIPKVHSVLHKDSKKKRITLNLFELSTTLGTGSFGRVRLVKYKPSSEWFAMKMLRKTKVVEMKQENHIKWEKKILSSIRHPFIVNLEASFQDEYFLYLVLEVVSGGEFFSLLRKLGHLKMTHAVFYSAQIVLVFQFLHQNRIVYRDLKPENLLIGADGYLRLTDFGFAKRLEKPYKTWTLCGTPEYIAPEILLNRGHSFSVDWWALGILLYEMFMGSPPFVDDNPMKIYQKILDGRMNFQNTNMPGRAQDFISKLLTKNLSHRIGNLENGAIDVMKHPFYEGVDWKRIIYKKVQAPYCPQLKGPNDTGHFDKYDETSDTEDVALDNDPFDQDF